MEDWETQGLKTDIQQIRNELALMRQRIVDLEDEVKRISRILDEKA